MTQFGVTPSSTSPAARRLYEAGERYAASLRESFAREAEEMRREREERRRALIERTTLARRRAVLERIETAMQIAKALPRNNSQGVRDIMKEVCDLHGISLSDMLGPARFRRIVRARQHAMWLCHKRTRFSFVRLGRFFQRDHSTVMHGIRAHEERTQSQ